MLVCALFGFASLAHSQQIDIAGGAGTLMSTKNTTASQTYFPPPEKGGTYINVSVDRLRGNHFGLNAEVTWRAKYALYNYYHQYRPILYDLNVVYAPPVGKKTTADFMAGAGGQTVLFYNGYGACYYPSGCVTHLNSNHFLMHLGADVRYSFWRNLFIRPEVHYYYIVNNTDVFHSANVLRVGASIGYTFHRD